MPISKNIKKIGVQLILVTLGVILFTIETAHIEIHRTADVDGLLFLASLLLCTVSIIISIVFFIKEKAHNKGMHGNVIIYLATMILTITTSLVVGLGITYYIRMTAMRVVCGLNLSSLCKSIALYANENHDCIPDVNNWCDLLILKSDAAPRPFICYGSDTSLGESSYALNKYVAGKKIGELASDTVLIFDTDFGKSKEGRTATISSRYFYQIFKQTGENLSIFGKNPEKKKVYKNRWNQAGGPEILTADNHKGFGANIAFADGYTAFIAKKNFGKLNWGNKTADPNSRTAVKK